MGARADRGVCADSRRRLPGRRAGGLWRVRAGGRLVDRLKRSVTGWLCFRAGLLLSALTACYAMAATRRRVLILSPSGHDVAPERRCNDRLGNTGGEP